MPRYTVHLQMRISTTVEVETRSVRRALGLAEQLAPSVSSVGQDWDEVDNEWEPVVVYRNGVDVWSREEDED